MDNRLANPNKTWYKVTQKYWKYSIMVNQPLLNFIEIITRVTKNIKHICDINHTANFSKTISYKH